MGGTYTDRDRLLMPQLLALVRVLLSLLLLLSLLACPSHQLRSLLSFSLSTSFLALVWCSEPALVSRWSLGLPSSRSLAHSSGSLFPFPPQLPFPAQHTHTHTLTHALSLAHSHSQARLCHSPPASRSPKKQNHQKSWLLAVHSVSATFAVRVMKVWKAG